MFSEQAPEPAPHGADQLISDAEAVGGSLGHVVDAIYEELKRVAAWHLSGVRDGVTLHPTDLAHEAIGRLLQQDSGGLRDREHALAIASIMVRRVLSNHLRSRSAVKRGGRGRPVSLMFEPEGSGQLGVDELLEVGEAIDRLASIDERQARVLQMWCFGGLGTDAIGRCLSVSQRTVQVDLTHARLWLARELGR